LLVTDWRRPQLPAGTTTVMPAFQARSAAWERESSLKEFRTMRPRER
jgi:hypothetical protein